VVGARCGAQDVFCAEPRNEQFEQLRVIPGRSARLGEQRAARQFGLPDLSRFEPQGDNRRNEIDAGQPLPKQPDQMFLVPRRLCERDRDFR
jgi:hypothetical protein